MSIKKEEQNTGVNQCVAKKITAQNYSLKPILAKKNLSISHKYIYLLNFFFKYYSSGDCCSRTDVATF